MSSSNSLCEDHSSFSGASDQDVAPPSLPNSPMPPLLQVSDSSDSDEDSDNSPLAFASDEEHVEDNGSDSNHSEGDVSPDNDAIRSARLLQETVLFIERGPRHPSSVDWHLPFPRSRSPPDHVNDMPTLLSIVESELSDESSSGEADTGYDIATAARFAVYGQRTPFPEAFPTTDVADTSTDSYRSSLKRAKELIDGLELVPYEWLLRYKTVQGGSDDCVLCAICHDSLLDDSPHLTPTPSLTVHALPCKHLFHTLCLEPWLGRKSTCPTCRFDLDPHSISPSISDSLSTAVEFQRTLRLLRQTYWDSAPFSRLSRRLQQEEEEDTWSDLEGLPPLENPLLGSVDLPESPNVSRVDVRSRMPPSLLTPISSRAQTLDTPGEQLPFEQMRWPPGRSDSIESSTPPSGSAVHSPIDLREALFRRMRQDSIFHNVPSPSVRASSTNARASTLPQLPESPLQDDAIRRSTLATPYPNNHSGVRGRVRRRASLSPQLPSSSIFSSESPEAQASLIAPVAPFLGPLHSLPPISPDHQHFPTFNTQDDLEEDVAITPDTTQVIFPSWPPAEAPNMESTHATLSTPEVASIPIPPTPLQLPTPLESPLAFPFHSHHPHTLLSETLRRMRDEVSRVPSPSATSGLTPESFTFGASTPDDSDEEIVESPIQPKWERPQGQNLREWIEEREAELAQSAGAGS